MLICQYDAKTHGFSRFAADFECLGDKLYVCSSLQLVASVRGDVEINQVTGLQRVVALLVLVAVRNLDGSAS